MTSPSLRPALGLLSLTLLAGLAPAAHSQEFATSATGSHLSTNPLYSDPNAALGQPTTLVNGIYDSPPGTYHRSLVYTAYNTDPNGNNLLVSLGSTGQGVLTVKFDAPIVHSDSHWFGEDLIVFGNQGFIGDAPVTPNTDMSQLHITDGSTYGSLPTVSVSADGFNFVTLTPADSVLYPENPYRWVGISAQNPSGWDDSHLQDFSKPVDPSLTAADFAGQTAAFAANNLYNGSAGGTAFSLANTPFAATGIQYIRFTGTGVIDGVSRVENAAAPVPELGSGWLLGVGLVFIVARLRRKTSGSAGK
jgi:hypothetical protein